MPPGLSSDRPGGVELPESNAPDITGVSDSVSSTIPEKPFSVSNLITSPEDDPFQPGFTRAIPARSSLDTQGTANTTVGGEGDDTGSALKDAGFTEEDASGLFDNATDTTLSTVTNGVDDVASTVASTGSDLSAFFSADAIASSIPVAGEIAAAVGGLVALGDGIAHLFEKPKEAPTPQPVQISLPSGLTAKYADSVPSSDGTVQRSASSSVF